MTSEQELQDQREYVARTRLEDAVVGALDVGLGVDLVRDSIEYAIDNYESEED